MTNVEIIMGIDTTGSMQSVINNAVDTAKSIESTLKESDFNVNLTLAGVNDYSPIQVKHDSPITWNVDLNSVSAHGGGDTPEAYSTFIDEACDRFKIDNSIRIIILIGDSYGHGMPPIQGGKMIPDSFVDGDPNGSTIPSSMKKMKDAKVTFYYVLAGHGTENAELWGAANSKYTNGTVIPMQMKDFEENHVAKTLSLYIEGQVSMVSALKNKKLEGKSVDEIATILSEYMNEKGKKVVELSETIEHSATDAMINSVDSNDSFYRSLQHVESQTLHRMHDGSVTTKKRHVSAAITPIRANSSSRSVRRAVSIASQFL
jgi:hypothetical protein